MWTRYLLGSSLLANGFLFIMLANVFMDCNANTCDIGGNKFMCKDVEAIKNICEIQVQAILSGNSMRDQVIVNEWMKE